MKSLDNFAVLILTNGRPDNVVTYETLRKSGYTGRIYLVVDDLDQTRERYQKLYGDEVFVFDKRAAAIATDSGDNLGTLRGVVYARNASFDVARRLGLETFVALDDDYTGFQYRFNERLHYAPKSLKKLDDVFAAFVEFLSSTGTDSIAMAQGGDYIGGSESSFVESVQLRRKLMNSFFCRVDRPFKFLGRINEDTTLYVDGGARGRLFFTTNQVNLNQIQTQANPGGLTEIYLDAGTYVKSFYSVLYQPSSVKVGVLRERRGVRLHHRVDWKTTVPKILRESFKKMEKPA